MVKLSTELITQAAQYMNPINDRELDLRGYKIPVIENMGATLDQFDTIDFSDNDIRKLDGFPLLKRLKCLMLNNNRIVRITENLEMVLPNLEVLILTGNLISELSDIDVLATLPKLRSLSLLHCPIVTKQHYRQYVIHKLSNLKLLDFRKIKLKDREDASVLFKSKKGKDLQKEINNKKPFIIPENVANEKPRIVLGKNQAEIDKIREVIQRASTLEEVEQLNRILQSGHFSNNTRINDSHNNDEVDKEDDIEEVPDIQRMELD